MSNNPTELQVNMIIGCVNQVISDSETNNPKNDGKMFNTRRVSKLLDMTARTIRFYEEMGIGSSKRVGVTRFFPQIEVNCLMLAKHLRTTGLDVKSVANLIQTLRSDMNRQEKLQTFVDIMSAHSQKLADHDIEVQRQIALSRSLSTDVELQA